MYYKKYYNNKKMSFLEIPFFEINDAEFESILKFSRNYLNIQKIAKKLNHYRLKAKDLVALKCL